MKTKKLKLFNGRGYNGRGDHLYVAAWSMADAVRISNLAHQRMTGRPEDENSNHPVNLHEISKYWSKNCWGNTMDKLMPVPERSVWYSKHDSGYNKELPKRIF